MALNYSHRAEDNLVSPMRIGNGCLVEGIPGDGFSRQWGSVEDPRGDDINMDWENVLPVDPFGMDRSSTVSAITGFLEYLEADYVGYGYGYGYGYGTRADVGRGRDSSLFAGLNLLFNEAIDFHPFPGMGSGGCFGFVGVNFDNVDASISGQNVNSGEEITAMDADPDYGAPHPAFNFALTYLCSRDLLAVGMVCKSLHDVVPNDPLLWRTIDIASPLNDRLTDDILVQLANNAQGSLVSLNLVRCQRITDDGLKRVLDSNMRLTKLSVPGCTRLSIDNIVNYLRDFKMVAITGIKYLRIGDLYGVTEKHFEELMSLLGVPNQVQASHHRPHFFNRGNYYLSCEDDRPIDIEMCPRCQTFKLVYDCPAESCQVNDHAAQLCRACRICIPRCADCGRCFKYDEYEETFFLENLCSNCCKNYPETQNRTLHSSKNAGCREMVSSSHG